jgi:hypothetical protein
MGELLPTARWSRQRQQDTYCSASATPVPNPVKVLLAGFVTIAANPASAAATATSGVQGACDAEVACAVEAPPRPDPCRL